MAEEKENQNESASSDHKVIGRELKLFSFDEQVPGVVYWWPKGNLLFNLIVGDLKKNLDKQGYQDVKTSTVISVDTLKKSGHFDNYYEKLFFTGNSKDLEKPKWCLKPMNCPGTVKIFNEEIHSYKELPLKFSEVGTVYRYEQAGEVNGLLRTRALTIDDAHIFCETTQIEEEIVKLIDFIYETYKRYGYEEINIELSTRPEKSIGTDEQWEKAESALKNALKIKKMDFKLNEGDGAFYGPKIDFHIKDSLGRSWQLGTIQLDFSMAERLEVYYVDQDGKKKIPVMIHRAILGSIERFTAILLEHTGGALPSWLAPVQAVVCPVSDKHNEYAAKISKELSDKDVRVEVDDRNESVGRKIRDGELQKVPYIIVVGDKEEKDENLSVRKIGSKELTNQTTSEFIQEIQTA